MLAAEALLRPGAHGGASDDSALRAHYENSLRALKPRFEMYNKASVVNQHPWLADLVVWRARRSARIRDRPSRMREEKQNPGHLFTLRGAVRLMLE